MDKIDIIVPYVNENDPTWQEEFNYYREQEIQAGIQTLNNKQAFAKERTRNWEAFRYWFRGVEKNCPWVNKVFLVVQKESQIPSWLNKKHPKLRIVYHEEFIPKEFLPTFSTLVIETFYYRIPDLSEHFIVSNDDFYFLNSIQSDLFFKDGKIHQGFKGYRKKNWRCGNNVWETIINNNNNFLETNIIRKPTEEFYHYSHLPDGRVKSFEIQFMKRYEKEIFRCMGISKFRHPTNLIPSLLFIDTMKYTNYGIIDLFLYNRCYYVAMNSRTNFEIYANAKMICFNDTASVDKFEIVQNNLLVFLNKRFPNKSEFEINDVYNIPTEYIKIKK